MAVLDLWTGQMCELPEADTHIETSAAAGRSAAIAMARFFYKFFHEFFVTSLDKLSAKSQLVCMVFWHSQAMSARRC